MKTFLDDDFLLKNDTAKTLYHAYAKDAPIIDYHCHLSPREIAEDKTYKNITELWLGGDHYKWRIMRSNGVTEDFITGTQDDYAKFMAFATSLPYAIGNPMYHWTHLELKRYFGIDLLLNEKTAPEIWEKTNAMLKQDGFSAQGLISRSNVEVICTTDDPIDDLEHHKALAVNPAFPTAVLPAFRPDKGINIDLPAFKPWITALSEVVGFSIDSLSGLLKALEARIDYFHETGCRLSDHALDTVQYASRMSDGTLDITAAEAVFKKAMNNDVLTEADVTAYKSVLLPFLGRQYAKRNWVMQIHIGALRNNSKRMLQQLGPDTGFDSIHDSTFAPALSALMDDLDSTDELPKTILYGLNPRDNYVIATMIGNFQGGGIPGKIQFGSAWWFCDQKEGMLDQMTALANLGLLSRFVGMLTDSRSFLSYTRHEYFRRILCSLVGTWVEEGEYPNDIEFLGKVVQDICINNARKYFQLIG